MSKKQNVIILKIVLLVFDQNFGEQQKIYKLFQSKRPKKKKKIMQEFEFMS